MKVGVLGLGKLGAPIALAIEAAGHEVKGFDPSPSIAEIWKSGHYPHREPGVPSLLARSQIELVPIADLAEWSELVLVVVQTPHVGPEFEGIAPLGDRRADFDYTYLAEAVSVLDGCAAAVGRLLPVVIVSTVLPGTTNNVLRPLARHLSLAYSPSFVAMGTTIEDFRNPEFALVGVDRTVDAGELMCQLHRTVHQAPIVKMRIESAELTKVAYNVLLGTKITVVNLLAQICDEREADVDEVTNALGLATQRLLSPAYMRAGMGDGGGCHPRDLIALSWLARELQIPDLFSAVMEARQGHTEWLADLARSEATKHALPVVILGKAYKAESAITTGSPAVLLQSFLPDAESWDPYVDGERFLSSLRPAVYVIATLHEQFKTFPFPEGSVVVDPWGAIPSSEGIDLVKPGRYCSTPA